MPDSRDRDNPGATNDAESELHARRCVQLFLQRFPHICEMSQPLFAESEAFRELCEEYEACTQVIERLEHCESNAALLTEYSALRLRLEGELLRCISTYWGALGPR